ncbi:MAG: Dihydroneopterin aldolase [Promethearchaeota archaeon]|nr:MAG: Dihydroneopterin aldolase [Candidatus Lokiarchaeota archaeon]
MMMADEMKIYFSEDITERERACFEAGIKLGALYHILSGIPIVKDENIINSIEKGIQSAISCQPFVETVEINLDRKKILGKKEKPYKYDEIHGEIIKAKIMINYKTTRIIAKVEWVENLMYPLMFIEKIEKI